MRHVCKSAAPLLLALPFLALGTASAIVINGAARAGSAAGSADERVEL